MVVDRCAKGGGMMKSTRTVGADVSRACGLLLWQVGMLTGKRHRITVVEIDP